MSPRPHAVARTCRAVVAAAGVVATLVAWVVPAVAHETGAGVRTVVDGITLRGAPPPTGVTVQTATSVAPQLLLGNDSATPVTVLDERGRPFLRISADGVEADLTVESWYRLNDPLGLGAPPDAPLDDDPTPEWTRITDEPAWGWFDHRMHPGRVTAPATPPEEPVDLRTWEIPVRVGGTPGAIRGRVVAEPVLGRYVAALDEAARARLPGNLTAGVLSGPVPGITITNRTGTDVVVRGRAGEPFLRFAADGTVAANLRSPSWYDHARLATDQPVPVQPPDPAAEPRWEAQQGGGTFGWLEPRAAAGRDLPVGGPAGTDGDPATERSWEIPIDHGGRRVVLVGHTRWVPASGSAADGGGVGGPALTVAALAVGAALLLWARRRSG